jgi:hypothetical protein
MAEKNDYIENLQTFENFLDFAIEISDNTAGLKVPPQLVRANQLYTRLTVTSVSIIHLLPLNRMFPTTWEFWDFFSVATLARNLIENYHMFYYVAVDKISDEERDFRLKLLSFHLNNEKYKLYSEFKAQRETLEDFETNLPKDKEDLKNHSFFKALSKEKAGKILAGKEAMYLSHKEISEKISFKTDEFVPLYRLFSNHTHSSPFAYFTMSNERGRGEENDAEISYLSMTLDFCIKYLSAAIIDMTNLFPICVDKLNQTKLKIVTDKFYDYSR